MAETIGVLSILEGDLMKESQRLWKLFENTYESKGVQSFDYPNVSFQGGHCQDTEAVKEALVALSRKLSPFTVIVDGLDYFNGAVKTVFLNVEITPELQRINQMVDEMLAGCCDDIMDFYRPEHWRPHITVAMNDLTDANFARAWHDLRDYHPRYQQTLSNICLVYLDQATDHIEIAHRETLA